MAFHRAGQLARETPVVRLADPLGLVAENLRESHYGAIPVIEGEFDKEGRTTRDARVLGLIFEHDLAAVALPALAGRQALRTGVAPGGAMVSDPYSFDTHAGSNGAAPPAPPAPGQLTARDVMHAQVAVIPSVASLSDALQILENYNAPALPVIDEGGGYRGMIDRADIMAALGEQVRPPMVGGMATPLGVWLTTGHISGGAPPLGLYLSGAVMGLAFMIAHYILLVALLAINQEWGAMFLSGRLGSASDASNFFNIAVTVAESFLFLVILRLMPLSGIHAAEHQTVWAIERGVPLLPEYVRKMPRAHPRCGTNLVALGGLIQIVIGHLPEFTPFNVLLALAFVYFTWRSFGTALQEYFTTRPASPKQLESGIRAGKELLAKYQLQPHMETSFGRRLFNSGLLLAIAGMVTVYLPIQLLVDYVAAQWLRGG